MNKNNNLVLGVSIGFVGGAILGTLIGVLTNDFSFWISIGVGFGLAVGGIYELIQHKKK